MTVRRAPVFRQPPHARGEQMAGEIGIVGALGPDEEPAVLRDPAQPRGALGARSSQSATRAGGGAARDPTRRGGRASGRRARRRRRAGTRGRGWRCAGSASRGGVARSGNAPRAPTGAGRGRANRTGSQQVRLVHARSRTQARPARQKNRSSSCGPNCRSRWMTASCPWGRRARCRLDFDLGRPKVPTCVSRLRLTFALLLAALWLPAVLHCQLEAADVPFLTHDHDHGVEVEHAHGTGSGDDHHAFKDTPVRASKVVVKLLPPGHSQAIVLLRWLGTGADAGLPALSPERHPPPLELRVAWHFLARAAPPARAPSRHS